ncbi:hypothetical protein [Rhizobium paknamense]|uniref:Uncharacterized protein n=2 Tax=Rhizobium paknamense TaxID=1206817 RepID=A0ABU0IBW5_9HYPH|nr:hypothetical protein [Rhizobium paknamense]MDQ0454734.1 hypothetical protein [Rhizobium paknamense]
MEELLLFEERIGKSVHIFVPPVKHLVNCGEWKKFHARSIYGLKSLWKGSCPLLERDDANLLETLNRDNALDFQEQVRVTRGFIGPLLTFCLYAFSDGKLRCSFSGNAQGA